MNLRESGKRRAALVTVALGAASVVAAGATSAALWLNTPLSGSTAAETSTGDGGSTTTTGSGTGTGSGASTGSGSSSSSSSGSSSSSTSTNPVSPGSGRSSHATTSGS